MTICGVGIVVAAIAQTNPLLGDYFTLISPRVLDGAYSPRWIFEPPFTADLNGDGNEDLVILGVHYALSSEISPIPQPGRVFLGDGSGNFTAAPSSEFPVDTFKTVHPRKALFADMNGDGRLDMFVACHGWDREPYPGEQNRLYLSQPGGGWTDATNTLPQVSDYSHSAAIGDLSGRGTADIIVNNYFGGGTRINSYALLNNSKGQFSMTRAILPVDTGEAMDAGTGHWSLATTITDLDRDGLPEVILGADNGSPPYNRLTQSTILWNHGGSFADNNNTVLPAPVPFRTHSDLDIQSIELDGDGLPDLVIIGTQTQPFYEGWFVQLLLNRGDRTFADVTADRLAAGDVFGGIPDVASGAPWPVWVKVLDYNSDGFQDFAVEYYGSALPPTTPLIYLNDGTGHFSTLKVRDFVSPGNESALGGGLLVPTRNGYSFITLEQPPGQPGLNLKGLLATKPYHGGPAPSDTPSFSVSNRGGTSVATGGQGSSITVGYGRIQADSGKTTPSGIAIFGYRKDNTLVSEVGVPAVPARTAGRLYAEIAGSVNAGVAIANPNVMPATVTFEFTDASGNAAGGGTTTIPANQQIAQFLDQAPFNVYRTPSFQGTFSFTSTVPVAVVALRGLVNERGDFLMSTLPVIDTTPAPASGSMVVPHFADGGGWTTQTLLVNPTDVPMSGSFQFLDPSGLPMNVTIAGQNASSFNYSVPGRSSQKHSTSGKGALTVSGSIRITTTGGGPSPVPLIVFSYRSVGVTVSEAGVPALTTTASRLYVESSGQPGETGTVDSGIAVANTSATTAVATFDLTDLAGMPVPGISPVAVSVTGMGQTAKFLTDIFPSLPKPFKGVLRITSTPKLSVVGLRTRINERRDFLITTTSPVDENLPASSDELFFPQVADGGGYTTQFILFSGTTGQTTSGILRLLKAGGSAFGITQN